uniref:NB-ARC domain-containing protein n=1 Tax=Nelumbo nucifera TaxID=4432 RepID=A0A822Z4Q4_NELNU|nr:TPA_asm: hypothetical protein HUJ06_013923 [Nelumbo nucifera]
MGCKILITTRQKDICDAMGSMEDRSTQIFNLRVLTEEESWDLFKRSAGSYVESPIFKDVAYKVAKECGGLPLALIIVGRALKGKQDIKIWEEAANELNKSRPIHVRDVQKKVLGCLEWSYNHLPNEETKQLFLLCCLFPEDHNISVRNVGGVWSR